jgi:hypothetical protein
MGIITLNFQQTGEATKVEVVCSETAEHAAIRAIWPISGDVWHAA